MWVVEKLLSWFNICGCVGQVASRRAEQNICSKLKKKKVWVSLPEISLSIWNLCCKPQGTSRRAGFRRGEAFFQPLQLPQTRSWFGLLLCVAGQPVMEFQLPPALPGHPTSSLSFWAPGMILFHPFQTQAWNGSRLDLWEWCSNTRCGAGLSDLTNSPGASVMWLLAWWACWALLPGTVHLSAGKKKVNLSRYSTGYCSQLSGGNRPGIIPSN